MRCGGRVPGRQAICRRPKMDKTVEEITASWLPDKLRYEILSSAAPPSKERLGIVAIPERTRFMSRFVSGSFRNRHGWDYEDATGDAVPCSVALLRFTVDVRHRACLSLCRSVSFDHSLTLSRTIIIAPRLDVQLRADQSGYDRPGTC